MTTATALRLGGLHRGHRARVQEILLATGAFRDEEVAVGLELFDVVALSAAKGSFSNVRDFPLRSSQGDDYEFVGLFTYEGALAGYACYGATPGTDRTYDLYWIAVHPEHQGAGGGSRLLEEVERRLHDREARMLVVETSSRVDYASTRRFYENRGYHEHARLGDFYAPGDDRVIYAKRVLDQYQTLPGSGV